MKKIRIIDTTLRDGMHAVSHQFSPDDVAAIAKALDGIGLDTIEVGHGDGLGGSSFQYGFAKATDADYIRAAAGVLTKTKLAVLLLPGIGTHKHLEEAAKCGAKAVRIATHVTEADIAEQHIRIAKDLGMEAITFLMMAHMAPVEELVRQARLFDSYGADLIYVTDSAGALLPHEVRERVAAVKAAVSAPVALHAHNNLGLAVGNNLAAIEAGASCVDGCLCGLGAAAGNAQTEILAVVFQKMGIETGLDAYKAMDAAENIVRPRMHRPILVDKLALATGWSGVYGSFMLHAVRAGAKYNVDPRDILMELGRRHTVGGQEDLILSVASEIASQQQAH
ncbi:MAG: 4-hydroxy-2-oxovalerate aldolase [Candidatus Adiutrix sp.]|jgi:4-hydroxy 2-oxovalerate aldolase|nr:4-hydroxy-2-oxovalerate aldolase [Candidatus Adiutrix sp.]